MDQDFHYYGTYHAARAGGFDQKDATTIAKAANFVDFFDDRYKKNWRLVDGKGGDYLITPRYTVQGTIKAGFEKNPALWCSYHFLPGNYEDKRGTPSIKDLHGKSLAKVFPEFQTKNTNGGKNILETYKEPAKTEYLDDLKWGKLLNRPQSPLSRWVIKDAITCATSLEDKRIKSILNHAYFAPDSEDYLRRFKLILLGIRAHVIADTWAHQNFCGLDNVMNTYWDVDYDPKSWKPSEWGYGLQHIKYKDEVTDKNWTKTVLTSRNLLSHPNLIAVPNATSYLGHGWMGHLPDFSFVKFQYKPCWHDPEKSAVVRDNFQEYCLAWIELASLFFRANGKTLEVNTRFEKEYYEPARNAIISGCDLAQKATGRSHSAKAWKEIIDMPEKYIIDVDKEPDEKAELQGIVKKTDDTSTVDVCSDLYLFQIAADYHFHFVKDYLERLGKSEFDRLPVNAWSQQTSALSPEVSNLFAYRIKNVTHNTVLDDWGGKIGQNSAALEPDNNPDCLNRAWVLIPNTKGFRIKSVAHGTVLDDWGGRHTGIDSASLQRDDNPEHENRTWNIIPNKNGFRIMSLHNTVLDAWGGKTGENSAALQPDNNPEDENRTWIFIKVDPQ
ncbi:RICIN domain-containing protein [uncultured Desulfobacter sp.]|uniref:RICIN domain-containing protein n=1 Tax=uncultured Desulfobacter sp. TaxID=240139 RepID=UPI00259B72D5|nr:RICIN domain-containing protein [uncultured Desulfobacter sp.]